MLEEKNQKQENKGECPLCQISDETLKRLETSAISKNSAKKKEGSKSTFLQKVGKLAKLLKKL